MTDDRRVKAAKPERTRRDVSGFDSPPPVEITFERAVQDERVVEVVLIAPAEDGDRPL